MTHIEKVKELSALKKETYGAILPPNPIHSEEYLKNSVDSSILHGNDMRPANDTFNVFLNFIENMIKGKTSEEISNKNVDETQNRFSFNDRSANVRVKLDLFAKEPKKMEETPIKKTSFGSKFIFPIPVPRLVNKPIEHFNDITNYSVNGETSDDKISHKNIFIPKLKLPEGLTLIEPTEQNFNKGSILDKPGSPSENIELSYLLRKRNVEELDLAERCSYRPIKSREYYAKYLSSYVSKVKSFWVGSSVHYPHCFKRMFVRSLSKNVDPHVTEVVDFSNKIIPAMSLDESEVNWSFNHK